MAKSTRLRRRRNCREELPQLPRLGGGGLGAAKWRYPASEVRGGNKRSYPASGVRGGWEEQPHVQGAVTAQAQEGLEELSHVEGQEGQQ